MRPLRVGCSSAHTHLHDTDACSRWSSWLPMSSASVESSSASATHLAMPPSCADACGNRSLSDGTIFVEPKGSDKEAKLGDRVVHQARAKAGVRSAAHLAQAAARARGACVAMGCESH